MKLSAVGLNPLQNSPIYLTLPTLGSPHGRQLWEWTASDRHVIIGQSSSGKGIVLASRPPGVAWGQLFIEMLSVWFNSAVRLLTACIPPVYCKNGITTILEIAVLAVLEPQPVLTWSLLVNTLLTLHLCKIILCL